MQFLALYMGRHLTVLSFSGAVYEKSDTCWIVSGTFEEQIGMINACEESNKVEAGKVWMEFNTAENKLIKGFYFSDPHGHKAPKRWRLIDG